PEYVENFMKFIAQQMREIMAKLGVKSVEELCGRTDLLKLKDKQGFKRASLVDMSRVLGERLEVSGSRGDEWKTERSQFNFELEKRLDLTTLVPEVLGGESLPLAPADKSSSATPSSGAHPHKAPGKFIKIQSTDRTVGTILGSEIQKKYGNTLKDDTYLVHFKGGAGQSFGAFIPKGLTLKLEGDANDAFGKGLSGGKLIIKKPEEFEGEADKNIIVGNVALFGATSGKAFINGLAGERFCVRNSGASVVAEGCGDHGLEYMTGGTAVILGSTGKNLCAGMSGGLAYVLDENHDLYKRLNHELVKMYALEDATTTLQGISDEESLHQLIEEHAKETGSKKAKEILADWENYKSKFKKIIPNDYLKIMKEIAAQKEAGLKGDAAILSAFRKCTA
ncbi:MAG: glutamate synthase subunit alpha, partial [Treponema sp.]|nr:glutamate synthase subunit alpha [Treponema sp.]